jgi:hypothetical protein
MQRSIASTTGYHMRDAMVTRFETISHGDSLAAVVDRLRHEPEDFPVTHGEQVLALDPAAIVAALASEGKEALVAGSWSASFLASPDADLTKALEMLKSKTSGPSSSSRPSG